MIVSIGEIVWDVFKNRAVLGGAPVNVAYHLHSLAIDVRVITRVGTDELGTRTRSHVESLGLSAGGLQTDTNYATGVVNVTVDEHNEPHFDIVTPAAWDRIDTALALQTAGPGPFGLLFGTLAQRDPVSRAAIRALWKKAARCYYDVNLRPPFTTRALVMESLAAADVVKMNGNELRQIIAWAGIEPKTGSKAVADKVRELRSLFNLEIVVVTDGDRGAWLDCREGFFEHPGFPAEVADTVGAGDAFFAALIAGMLAKRPWPECLAEANRRGAYVASRPGATPPMPGDA